MRSSGTKMREDGATMGPRVSPKPRQSVPGVPQTTPRLPHGLPEAPQRPPEQKSQKNNIRLGETISGQSKPGIKGTWIQAVRTIIQELVRANGEKTTKGIEKTRSYLSTGLRRAKLRRTFASTYLDFATRQLEWRRVTKSEEAWRNWVHRCRFGAPLTHAPLIRNNFRCTQTPSNYYYYYYYYYYWYYY